MTDLLSEDGIIVGNVYDKYQTRNPIARYLVSRFLATFDELLQRAGEGTVHEIGCGEGHLSARIKAKGYMVRGSDFSPQIIAIAERLNGRNGIPFSVGNIYDLDPAKHGADIIVCCEVLEHLEHPEEALSRLARITRRHCLVSVPNEPLWSLMNLARGQYWPALGNTPGHVQRWSSRRFLKLLTCFFDLQVVRHPLPWTMALCTRNARTPKAEDG
jgi:2-polyprenyl-3-methyl-5-hydroxy-6-metoxy-1,4-benzoquinol methylase